MNICGLSPSERLCPTGEESWGLPWSQLSHRYTKLFEMHDESLWKRRGGEYRNLLKTTDVPIIMQQQHEDIPASVAFPLQQAIDEFGDYFNSSIAYMLSLAILEGHKEINIYGVDNHTDSEFAYERPCNEYLIGQARGRGITVNIHGDSHLLRFSPDIHFEGEIIHYTTRYGYLEGKAA